MDMKPENLLLDIDNNINGRCETWCGSANFTSAEVKSRRPFDGVSSDVWSYCFLCVCVCVRVCVYHILCNYVFFFGSVILYVMLCGYFPYDERGITIPCSPQYQVLRFIS
eukprot:GHVR01172401.1.p1 GENE.GHVR01172401.1~~GHVR01172401.1.p1  ORF type:complete len:110 (+),score=9.76 GHVR01172401.1:648-977(+)